jgi:diguanylate cyclase (GGDEF)-like protein
MDPRLPAPRSSKAIGLLVAVAVVLVVFTGVSTVLTFQSTGSVISSLDWARHSEEVILALQAFSSRLDRVDSYSRLTQSSADPDYARGLLTASVQAVDRAKQVEDLVHDNPDQEARAKLLVKQAEDLRSAVESARTGAGVPFNLILDCRETATHLNDAENQLLSDRRTLSNQAQDRIVLIRFGYAAGFMTVLAIPFFFLFRDALRRHRFELQMHETNLELARTVSTMERNAHESRLIASAREELQLCMSVGDIYRCAARFFPKLLPETSGALCIINNSWQNVEIASAWNTPSDLLTGFSLDSCCSLRSGGRLRWRRPGYSEVHCGHFQYGAPDNYLCMQLSAYGETLGILYVECHSAAIAEAVEDRLAPLQDLADLVSLSAASLNLRTRLESQSIRDGLTNLFNRHFMEIALERELRRAARHQKDVAVMMLDVDHFKIFNDTYGHDAGDMVLREVADCLTANTRSEDVVCRYGGEEFVAILPDISAENAVERANLLRRRIHEIVLRHRGNPLRQITISVGIAMFPRDADTMEVLLRTADRALYEAKATGRDRVVTSESLAAI